MTRICILLLLFGAFYQQLPGQKVLAVENTARMKRYFYGPGDNFRYRTQDSRATYSGRIISVGDTTLTLGYEVELENGSTMVSEQTLPMREIDLVYLDKKTYGRFFKNMYSYTAMIAGGVLIAGTAINVFSTGSSPDPLALGFAGGLLVSGFFVRYLGRDKFRIGKRWQLRSMEMMVAPPPGRLNP